jgi:hypothetical protein
MTTPKRTQAGSVSIRLLSRHLMIGNAEYPRKMRKERQAERGLPDRKDFAIVRAGGKPGGT